MRPSRISMETLQEWGKPSGWKRKTGTSRRLSSTMTASACSSWSLVTMRTVSDMVGSPRVRVRWRAGTGVPALHHYLLLWRRGLVRLGDDVVNHGVGVHVDLDPQEVERLRLRRAVRAGAHLRLRVVGGRQALAHLGVQVAGEEDGLGELQRKRQIRVHDRVLESRVG